MVATHKTTVLLGELRALTVFASIDASRFVLNGVLCEIYSSKTLLIASDGRRLAAIRTLAQTSEDAKPVSFIIPTALVLRMAGVKRRAKPHENEVEISYHGGEVSLRHGFRGYAITGKTIEGSYPNWRQVIPTRNGTMAKEPEPWSASALYLGDMLRVGRAMGLREPHVVSFRQSDPLSAIEVRFGEADNFYAVIMPLKTVKPPEQFDWLKL